LFAVDFLVVASPGPSFVATTQMSARHGSRAGLAAVAGITVAAWICCAAVMSGLTVLFKLMPWLYVAMKTAGGLYLAYLGLKLLRSRAVPAATGETHAAAISTTSAFRRGLLTGLTNPKALVYFGSIFTLFLKPGSPLWMDGAALGIVTFDCLVWYGAMSGLFSRPPVRRFYERMSHWLERAAGAVMLGFGLKLVLTKD
jgi:threonine efflux protein